MDIRTAVITAAGKSQRHLPLQTLVDRDGLTKSALQILLEEIQAAGIEHVAVVVCPGDEPAYASAAGRYAGRLTFVLQSEPRGYGHAVWCARQFTGQRPFLLLVGDHLYVSSDAGLRCAQQLTEVAMAMDCAVSAVQATHESKLPYYGAVGGRLITGRPGFYEVHEVLEKPTPTEAEQRLIVPGLRAGHYLCYFGLHVLTPAVMEILGRMLDAPASAGVQLSAALHQLARRERYVAAELGGRRYDIGAQYGLLTAQLALSLAGRDRAEVLSQLVELLATRPSPA